MHTYPSSKVQMFNIKLCLRGKLAVNIKKLAVFFILVKKCDILVTFYALSQHSTELNTNTLLFTYGYINWH